MGRPLRWLRPKTRWHLTNRTLQQRFLLRPDDDCNAVFLLALGRALKRFPAVKLEATCTVSNHFHALVLDDDGSLSAFMRDFETRLAKGINALRDRDGHVFGRRFSAEPVLDTLAAVHKLVYLVMNPASAGLVETWSAWPGVLLFAMDDQVVEHPVRWFNEKRYQRVLDAQPEGAPPVDRDAFWEEEVVAVHPLHGLEEENLTTAQLLEKIRDAELACARERKGRPVMGAATVVRQDPRARPKHPKRSPRPLCHAGSEDAYKLYREMFRAFCKAFWEAAASLRRGDGRQPFPLFSFPPWKPLVRPALSG